jgi:hypothetical protein
MPSFFAYGRYNLLFKFYDSEEYMSLEKAFSFMRSFDVHRCFAHIYTHSVTWAAKGKSHAKAHAHAYSFEGSFDTLMQKGNYNETNGIVIGPEISRIFAEIVLQDADLYIQRRLRETQHWISGRDYEMRRYVDDYFVFANSTDVLDGVQEILEECLEEYKLFLNAEKTRTHARPFISNITLAKADIGDLVRRIREGVDDLIRRGHERLNNGDDEIDRWAVKKLKEQFRDVRLICQRHNLSVTLVNGWFVSHLRVQLRRVIQCMTSLPSSKLQLSLEDIASSILSAAFYICAVDFRVRTTYNLCQLVDTLSALKKSGHERILHRLLHHVEVEVGELLHVKLGQGLRGESVEIYNILILGAHVLGQRFVANRDVADYIDDLLGNDKVSYFQYITLKFVLLKDRAGQSIRLDQLNQIVLKRIVESCEKFDVDSEVYMLCCDFLSALDVSTKDKRKVIASTVGGENRYSNAAIEEAGRHLAFSDWSGMRIQHLLARKELRPVYAWI